MIKRLEITEIIITTRDSQYIWWKSTIMTAMVNSTKTNSMWWLWILWIRKFQTKRSKENLDKYRVEVKFKSYRRKMIFKKSNCEN